MQQDKKNLFFRNLSSILEHNFDFISSELYKINSDQIKKYIN